MYTESSTQQWVAALKNAYPHLPDALPVNLEKKNLRRLDRWFEDVKQLRIAYDEMDRSDLPEELQNESGKRQIIPVLLSLQAMTQDERQAWHELFVCLSASMASIAHNYWQTHGTGRATMTLEDTLNYLPVVFLYVLSSYKEYPKGKTVIENEDGEEEEVDISPEDRDDFSHSDDGRVKLITWVHWEARRHINTYLQQHAYTIKQGSGYTHRLRQAVRKIQARKFAEDGSQPNKQELVEEIADTHYGKTVTKETLSDHVQNVLTSDYTISISDPLGHDADTTSWTYEDTLTYSEVDIQGEIYDPMSYLETRTSTVPQLKQATYKLLYTTEPLSFMELAFLGT